MHPCIVHFLIYKSIPMLKRNKSYTYIHTLLSHNVSQSTFKSCHICSMRLKSHLVRNEKYGALSIYKHSLINLLICFVYRISWHNFSISGPEVRVTWLSKYSSRHSSSNQRHLYDAQSASLGNSLLECGNNRDITEGSDLKNLLVWYSDHCPRSRHIFMLFWAQDLPSSTISVIIL